MAFAVERVVPILRSFDETRAREFYVGYLGCVVDWEHRFDGQGPLYMQ
ncbi:MAG: glyoxalase superfamily protein, partial [Actinomycetota bacterium]|nr:glyoxalase superfamily protein [Actinomycetota bacterium]